MSAGGGRPSHAIELEGVSFVYPDGTRALRDVCLAVPEGGRVAIVGQNGSGKSTLLRHLNGLLRPSSGRVLVRGRETAGVPVERIARQVGLLFQNPDLQIFEEQVADEVAFGPRNLGLTGADLAIAVTEALEAVGLRGLEHANPFNLGFSRRKLVALAAILAMRTPIVALDEPTTGQDGRGLGLVEGVVRRLADEGRTVLATSHDMRFVAETFERVVVMREGAIVADGTPDEVFAPAAWEVLRSTHLDPPPAAVVGAALGLGSTPTEAQLVAALRERDARYG